MDHVIPRTKGGKDEISNLVCSCRHCNSLKTNFDLSEFIEKHNLSTEILQRVSERLSERVSEKVLESLKEKDMDKEEEQEVDKGKEIKNNIVKASNVIDLFNKIYNKNCRNTSGNIFHIQARINDKDTNYTLEDFEKVFRKKLKDPYFQDNPKFYRIETLCGNRFDSYLNESETSEEKEGP